MGADPEPQDPFIDLGSQGSVVVADTSRPKPADPLEVQRRVARIRLEKSEVLVRQITDTGG